MGMTIEEAEQYLIALKYCETCEATDTNVCKTCSYHQRGSSAKCYDAIDVGVDTMRKYQNIKQILDDCLLDDWEILKSIRKVIEDGKID